MKFNWKDPMKSVDAIIERTLDRFTPDFFVTVSSWCLFMCFVVAASTVVAALVIAINAVVKLFM